MNLYDAIFVRKSVWKYLMDPIDKRTLENIMNFANHIEMLDEKQKVIFSIVNSLDKEVLPMGNFIVKAPYYFVLYAQKTEGYLVNSGYFLEQVALYLTTKGLASCFLELNKIKLESKNEYEPVLVLAFGKTDRGSQRDSKTIRRLKLEELCTFKGSVNENIKTILQAARYAPSVMNTQPWRFVAYDNRIHIFSTKVNFPIKQYKKFKQIDMGMMLANLSIAAEELWLTAELVKSENIADRNFKKNEYLTTVKISG